MIPRASHRIIASLLTVMAVASSPAPSQSCPDGAIRRFGTETRRTFFRSCSGGVYAVAYSPDGRLVATGECNAAAVWDVKTGERLHTFRNRSTVHAVAFSPDGKHLAWGGYGNSFALVDLSTGHTVFEPDAGICVGFFTSFSRDGRLLLSDGPGTRGQRADTLLLWDLETRRPRHELRVANTLRCGLLTPDGKTMITGDNRGTIHFRDTVTGRVRGRHRVSGGSVLDLSLTSDGTTLLVVSAAGDPYVETVDVATRRPRTRIPHRHPVRGAAISPDGRVIATLGNRSTLRFFDARTGRQLAVRTGHRTGGSALAFSPDGKRLVTGGFAGSALLWTVPPVEATDR